MRKVFVSMFFIALTGLGYISYKNLPVELFPNVELPMMFVQVNSRSDVNPDYMERNAIIPIEGVIGLLEGIESIDSYVNYRSGIIYISYKSDVDLKYAYLKLEERINSIKSSLDDEFIINILKIDTEQITNQFMDLQVRGSGDVDRVRNITDERIVDQLSNIDGIANVEVFGGRQKSIEIILDKDASEAYGITPAQVSSLVASNNQQRVFVGQAKENKTEYFVNLTAENTKLSDLENIVVRTSGPVRLKDIAKIYFGAKEEDTYSRVNGKSSVTIRLTKDSQANLIDLSHNVLKIIDYLNSDLSTSDAEIVVQQNQAQTMEENIDSIINLALTGGLLAMIVLWLFLKKIKLVLAIGLAIPISIFTAFNFFYAYDISINSLTLIGIALAVGMLLDNSVVVLENIYRLYSKGESRINAVVNGTKEVSRSIIAATLTTVTVFLPFVFSESYLISTFGTHIGVSIISTLLVSLVLSLVLIPMMTHVMLRNKSSKNYSFKQLGLDNRLLQIYLIFLKSCMRFPARTIIGAVILFFTSVFIALAISANVSEEVDTDTFNLYVQMPQGSSLDNSDETAKMVEERLTDVAEIKDVISKVYEDQSTITLKLKDNFKEIDNRDITKIKEDILSRIGNTGSTEISFDEPQNSDRFRGGGGPQMGSRFQSMLGIGAQTEQVTIKGTSYEQMVKTAGDIKFYLENLSSVQSAQVSTSGQRPEVGMYFDPLLMSEYDITPTQVAQELATFRSQFSSNTTFKEGTEEYDITIRVEGEEENKDKSIDDLRTLKIANSKNSLHELQEFSRLVYTKGLSSIKRVNQEKQVEVTYRLLSEVNDSKALLDQARIEIDEMIAAIPILPGIAVEVVHEDNQYDEYYFLIFVAILFIYFILASVFESLITPLILMFSIPLAAIGSLIALILTGNSLINTNTLTGFLILLGVVVNNGIILIDFTNILKKRGYSNQRALIVAGLARVRPILITAITTIVAMLPLALGDMEYVQSIGAPFAITVIGGLSVSTLFTLVFIPTFYSGLYSSLKWLHDLNWKVKVLQSISFIGLSLLIYFDIDSFIWQLVNLFVIIVAIPGITYFIMNSLRQAKTELIKDNEEIIIKIKNVVKIYDQPSRFSREWNKGKKRNNSKSQKSNIIENLVWQLPFIGFLIYYTYFYLESSFWNFIFVLILYFVIHFTYKSIFVSINLTTINKLFLRKLVQSFSKIFLWLFPIINIVYFYFKWENIGLVFFIFVIWYLSLTFKSLVDKLNDSSFDTDELTGKFKNIRRKIYNAISSIPFVGKKRVPFKALDKVSIEIGNGMFGLLGPNGAGKTTIMRIICGILEQSYGKITINGIDRNEYREELQGLIGYLPQDFGMYENMTAYEFLDYQAMLKGLIDKETRTERLKTILNSVNMFEKRNDKIGSFSGGMKQRIGIAQILIHLPKILVVDEPTAGLDPRERIRFRNLLVHLSRERIVIFSTHIIEDISSSCNRVAVMNQGEVKYLGDPANMTSIAEGKVWQAHLTKEQFDEMQNELLIVNHMRDGDKIRVRCIADHLDIEGATKVRASLEDAYLYLQKQNNTSIFK